MRIGITKGDITKEETDIIVNAANSALFPGGGVDGAITSAAGPVALAERMAIGGCHTGDAIIASGGNLKAEHIIYAVGPRYTDRKPELLASAYTKSMELAINVGAKSIAFPAISAGIYGFPAPEAADIAIDAVMKFKDTDINVTFVLFTDEVFNCFYRKLQDVL